MNDKKSKKPKRMVEPVALHQDGLITSLNRDVRDY